MKLNYVLVPNVPRGPEFWYHVAALVAEFANSTRVVF
jgi:hypothetical protein